MERALASDAAVAAALAMGDPAWIRMARCLVLPLPRGESTPAPAEGGADLWLKRRTAYRKVLRLCSTELLPGDTFAIMTERADSPMKASRSTCVSLEPRNGVCTCPLSSARMHSFKLRRDLLISAPSFRVARLPSALSAARSEPAKSTREKRP